MKNATLILALIFGLSLNAQVERFKKGGGENEEENTQAEKKKQEQSEEPQEQRFVDRLVFGGSFAASFGNTTNIMLNPQVGYKFNDKLVAGPGFIYNYLRIRQLFNPFSQSFEDVNIENTIYGPSAFVYYFPFKSILVGAQAEMLNFDYSRYDPISGNIQTDNIWQPVFWLQAGYSQPVGENGFVQIGVRANLLHDDQSPYVSWWMPVFNIFF